MARMRRVVSRRFDFARSVRARAAIAALHVATAALVACLPIDPAQALFGAWLALACGVRAARDIDVTIAWLIVRSDGTIVALGTDGRARPGRLVAGSVALAGYAAVAWCADGERRARLIRVPADRLAPDALRELRVLLRYATSGEEAGLPDSHAPASISAPLSALARPRSRCT